MNTETFLLRIINPGLDLLEFIGGPKPHPNAQRMLIAIGMQESGSSLNARYQNSPSTNPGPARGWFQFEQGGGVAGVLNHRSTLEWAHKACDACWVQPHPAAVWRALEGHDQLATIFARLLLWTDAQPLPTTEQNGWDYYIRNWRPGKPHPQNWPTNWRAASNAIREDLIA